MANLRRRGRCIPIAEVLEQVLQDGSDEEGEPLHDESEERDSEDDFFADLEDQEDDDYESEPEDYEEGDQDGEEEMVAEDGSASSSEDEDFARNVQQNINAFDMETDIDDADEGAVWVRNLNNFPRIPAYTDVPGLHVDLGDDPKPIDVYKLFLTDDIIGHIKTETNKYAESSIALKRQEGPLPPRSIFSTWRKVTRDDIRKFLAICMHMGIVRRPTVADYWTIHPGTHTSYATQLMTRERFTSILAFLHLNDNRTYIPFNEEGHDPIHKIRPFLVHLQDRFAALYTPNREICVDEAMCPFKGRSRFRVYMHDKPTKWGFKFYELCESKSAYVYRLEMFCADRRLSNKPYDVVMRLMEPLLNKGYHLFIDNYYCEPKICATLAGHATMVTGTVRSNRQQMPTHLAPRLQRGELDYMRRGPVVCVKWKDKKDVFMLSTVHMPVLERVQCRTQEKMKPKAVNSYVAHMAGVDNSDQLISYFPMRRKNLKWWKKPFFHLLTLCTIQTKILLNIHRVSRGRRKLKLDQVIKSLLLDLPPCQVQPPAAAADGPKLGLWRLKGRHFPSQLPSTPSNRKGRKNCYVCYQKQVARGASKQELKNKRKVTHYQCSSCIVALCVTPCFELFHTRKDFVH